MSLEVKIQHQFQKPELLIRALTHKSFSYEKNSGEGHNEKLEFLGDAVLDLVLGEYLMEIFADQEEGALSKKRASLVNENSLASVAKELDLQAELRLGKGEMQSGGATKPRLLASALEALVGAMYLDAGFEKTRLMIRRYFKPLIESFDPTQDFALDYKTRLQELAQKAHRVTPSYEIVSEEGPPHERLFTVALKLKEKEIARGTGRSKKMAEQEAARISLENNSWDIAMPAQETE